MKLYLASIMEPENFGSQRIIGIATGRKPKFTKIDFKYDYLIPSQILQDQYHSESKMNISEAADNFINGFRNQLNNFVNKVIKTSADLRKTPVELLPFQDGDTLVSWERKANNNYRGIVAEYLEKLGYEVISN
jgi:hypothetical protein